MEIIKTAEQELKALIEKYPTLEFYVVNNFAVGFKERPIEKVETEVIPPTPEAPVIDTPTIDPVVPQPEA
jgi:hypothetical protein